ncbi:MULTISPECIES: hypothetical protein [unclassified Pseudomonas]|uniref:hypothetical protein n=1 Tax=unclassified Pseudomonas TaxID=196821 RepID=UPI00083839B3|nr:MULTISPECIES: hypothetical protein [unclassified Pseudomonas]QIH08940.1 hypothetical protein ATY02_20475 [Pseudomonas sp. BIOMIG1BAC]
MRTLIFVFAALFSVAAVAETVAEKLTIVSLDKDVEASSPEVKRTQVALTRAMTVCNVESEAKLADIVWFITKKIRSEGHYAEATDLIEGVNAVLLGTKEKQDCTELLSLYAVNRIQGSTHSDAVAGGRGLYRGMGLVK